MRMRTASGTQRRRATDERNFLKTPSSLWGDLFPLWAPQAGKASLAKTACRLMASTRPVRLENPMSAANRALIAAERHARRNPP